MYEFTNLETEQKVYVSEDEMIELVTKKLNMMLGPKIPVQVHQCNITNANVYVNGRVATADYHILFPKSEISYTNEDPAVRSRKVMGDMAMPDI